MRKKEWFILISLVLIALLSIGLGRYQLSLWEVVEILMGLDANPTHQALIFQIRLPRIIMVVVSGMALGIAGFVYQKLFRNPLVSPDVLGASSGASLGAAFAIVFLGGSKLSVSVAAFIGSIGVVLVTVYLAKHIEQKVLGLLLGGIITSAMCSALLMVVKVLADPTQDLPSIEFWLMGGFYNASWESIGVLSITCLIGGSIILLLHYQLQVLMLGDDVSSVLGMSVAKVRMLLMLSSTLLVSSVVAMSGLISWIGLIAPHIANVFLKGKQKKWTDILMSGVWGGLLLVVADTVARTCFSTELPISVITSLLGGIILVVMLVKKKK